MRMDLKISAALLMFLLAFHSAQQSDVLDVKVFYETLCFDSVQFFRNHLYSSMKDKKRLQHANLELIPYGKVDKRINKTTNVVTLGCQHGAKECELNAIHACIIETNNISTALDVTSCMMEGYEFEWCANKYQINKSAVNECRSSRSIPEILEKYGQETDAIKIRFVPSVQIGNTFSYTEQYDLRNHFDVEFCRRFASKFNHTLEGCSAN